MPTPDLWPPNFRLLYVIDLAVRDNPDELAIEIAAEPSARNAAPLPFRLTAGAWLAAPNDDDREIGRILMDGRAEEYRAGRAQLPVVFPVRGADVDNRLAQLCDTGRARVRLSSRDVTRKPVQWDRGAPWQLDLAVHRDPASGATTLTGRLVRARSGADPDESESMSLATPAVIHPAGVLYVAETDTLARFEHGGAYLIAATLRNVPTVPLVEGELAELLETLYALPRAPSVALPAGVSIAEEKVAPRPWLTVAIDDSQWRAGTPLLTLGFEYNGIRVAPGYVNDTVFDRSRLMLIRRDAELEAIARSRLIEGGARTDVELPANPPTFTVARSKLGPLIIDLVREGWRVDASGVRYRSPTATRAEVRSGIDWFDLDLTVDYDGATASAPALIDALRRKQATVTLSDGSVGLLPIEWLTRFAPALATGTTTADATRFSTSQIGLLDALLAAMPDVAVDATFARARSKLSEFDGVDARDPLPSFRGTLREYQREGLGWLHFLREFGLGGCLADDMGLGKTIQVLALLDSLRGETAHPSIIVVPRSLVFNWRREAERFTPKLRVLDYSGARRRPEDINIGQYDVVITTYGTLRSDAAELSGIQFEYAVLDEAQAIKNAGTASAKAARLLRAKHRLALSGTPVENRIEELWSLFEFLNPGMLGTASTFSLMADLATDAMSDDAQANREILRRALRPVILRRTKEQVAPELPERVEQTLYVDLEPAQRTFYMDLLAATRRTVFDQIDRAGINASRMHILEALLRLRQAACAPVLADPTRPNLPSAKLDALIPTLDEIVAEGHKAVVFSQFTRFLALVRHRLEEAGIPYEYLDGSTRDREARVDHFQAAKGPPVFLVSLKAGGHGLNLTAADYVYLLDPWWNPAVEAQAIDRAHRIGQTRRVIATRLVARATIEEKVLELQASKRALADAILGADQGALGQIGREELEMLLGDANGAF